jgi:hypothetical protein
MKLTQIRHSAAPLSLALLTFVACGQAVPSSTPATPIAVAEKGAGFNVTLDPADRNAAIQYLRLSQTMTADVSRKFAEISNTELFEKIGYSKAALEAEPALISAKELTTVARPQDWVAASRLAKCDFENATEEGFAMLLPHLGQLRAGARMLRFFARTSFIENEAMLAAEYLEAIVRIGNHTSGDGVLISSLVGIAVGSLALTEMQSAATAGVLTTQARDHLLGVLELVNADDPMLTRASIYAERDLSLNHLLRTYTGPDAGTQLDESGIFGNTGEDDARTKLRRQKLREMDGRALAASVEEARVVYDELVAAWGDEDWRPRFEELETKVQSEEFGLIAALLTPSIKNVKASQVKFIEELALTRETLKNAKLSDDAATVAPAGR